MKAYHQLTPAQQQKAIAKFTNDILSDIIEGFVTFPANALDGEIKIAVENALAEADKMRRAGLSK